jgi:hypothetical protein
MSGEPARSEFYPEMPPGLPGETDDDYTDRLTGADGTGRVPYDHRRRRQCSIGWHDECSDPDGDDCKCPCHRFPVPSAAGVEPSMTTESQRTMREGILVGRSVRTRNGCWVAYYADRSAVAVFGDELAALRHAQEKSMDVKFMSWGDEL